LQRCSLALCGAKAAQLQQLVGLSKLKKKSSWSARALFM